jgi:hypothetical protein
VNRPSDVRDPEAVKDDAADDSLDTLGPLTPATPARAPTGPEARPPWGRLEGFTVRAVLRLLEAEGKDCTMTLQEAGRRALIHLRAGRPVHAECGSLTGGPALDDVLGWPDPVISIARLRYEGHPTFELAFEGEEAAAGGAVAEVSNPYGRLLRLAEAGETGELVVAAPSDEFHVHLQRGRVVWVSERHTRERFRRHLLAVAGTRDEDLRPVLEECRRSRLPLVETLVKRKLASPDQLRETFAAVFRDALAELRALPTGSCVFLRRGTDARHDMSFPLRGLEPATEGHEAEPDELSPAPPPVAPAPELAPTPPSEPATTPEPLAPARTSRLDVRRPPPEAFAASPPFDGASVTPGGAPVLTLESLASTLEGEGVPVEGVCLTRGLAIVPGTSPPTLVPSPGLLDLMGGPASDRAELVILRLPEAAVIGQRVGGRPLVAWCRTRPEAYASCQALLARLGGGAAPAARPPTRPAGRALRMHHDQISTDASGELTKLFTDNVDLLSALIVDASARSYLAVDGPSAPPLTWMLRRAISSAGPLGPRSREAAVDPDAPPPLLGARFAEGWWFGGPLLREPGHYGWLLLQPAAAQALGWLMAGRFCRRFALQPLAALDA